ncbi:MarR family winged helix-turn-helix transcriptional regulator [Brucella sp. 22210]|uniref:MarR family winged helix-turn-helix transcriptional regulator n=1 Tax=Brucella sp. 22210 TaxID=3453892 RepID=UPI003F83C9DC
MPEIPFSLLSLLGAIDRLGSDINPAALAEAEGLRSSNLAALLRKLQEVGYVIKRPEPSDKRMSRISLTSEGQSVLQRNRAHRESWLARNISAHLTKTEQATLFNAGELIEKLATIGNENERRDKK